MYFSVGMPDLARTPYTALSARGHEAAWLAATCLLLTTPAIVAAFLTGRDARVCVRLHGWPRNPGDDYIITD